MFWKITVPSSSGSSSPESTRKKLLELLDPQWKSHYSPSKQCTDSALHLWRLGNSVVWATNFERKKKCTTTDLPREKPLRYIGQYMQSSQYTGTTCCNIHTCAFCLQGVPFTCSIWLSQQVIQSINHLVSVMATKCIFCEVVRWELHF